MQSCMLSATAVWWIALHQQSNGERKRGSWLDLHSPFVLHWQSSSHEKKIPWRQDNLWEIWPTDFLTFTCNPKWREILANIPNDLTASDRPDMVARVFHLKKKELIDDIEKKASIGFRHGQNRSHRISKTRNALLLPAGMGREFLKFLRRWASLELPKICEDVVRGTCTHFSRSPKRRESFKRF